MLVLSLDTTTRFGSAGLVSEQKLLAEINYLSPSTHSRQVLEAIAAALRIAGIEFDQLQGLAVAAGPGSFTGIRIGLSLVKALSLASGLPVASVSSLQALASKLLWPGVKMISPVIDARKSEVFGCLYQVENSKLKEIVPAGAYEPGQFLTRLPAGEQIYFIGTGADLYFPLFREKLGERAIITDRSYYLASEIGQLGEALLSQGKGLKPEQIEPVYYRPSQAEEKKTDQAKK